MRRERTKPLIRASKQALELHHGRDAAWWCPQWIFQGSPRAFQQIPLGRSLCSSPVVMGGQTGTPQNEAGPSSYSLGFFQSENALERFQKALVEMCPLKPAVLRLAGKKMKH